MTFAKNPDFMAIAIEEARQAAARGEVPVGACVVSSKGELLASAGNNMRALHDPTAHAEMLAIREAAKRLGQPRLDGCDLWVTLEPCQQCAGAISLARIKRLYFGTEDAKGGAIYHGAKFFSQPTCHHRPEVLSGFYEDMAKELLKDFFLSRR